MLCFAVLCCGVLYYNCTRLIQHTMFRRAHDQYKSVHLSLFTSLGGWTLIKQTKLQSSTPLTTLIEVDKYTYISEQVENRVVRVSALLQLKIDMGFDQLRFYCHKKSVARTFHIMTKRNAAGLDAFRYLIVNPSPRAQACSSFTALPDDTSMLSKNCGKWGYAKNGGGKEVNLIGHSSNTGPLRLYYKVALWSGNYYTAFLPKDYWCDDDTKAALSAGDTFEIYVR